MSDMDHCQHIYVWCDTTQRTSHALLRCKLCGHQRLASVVDGGIVDPTVQRVGVVTYRLTNPANPVERPS